MEVFGAWADGNMYPSREIAVGARDAVNHTAQYHKFGHSQCKQLVSRKNCTALDYGVNLKQQSPNPVRPQCKALLILNDTGDFQKVHIGLVSKRRHPSIVGVREDLCSGVLMFTLSNYLLHVQTNNARCLWLQVGLIYVGEYLF